MRKLIALPFALTAVLLAAFAAMFAWVANRISGIKNGTNFSYEE